MTSASELANSTNTADGHSVATMATDHEPFNQYNTEVVKLDASNAIILPEGDLIGVSRICGQVKNHTQQQQDANNSQIDDDILSSSNTQIVRDDYDLFTPNYELVQHLIPIDSVNNKSFTDVTFIVGPPHHSKKYVGHRVLLAMTSPVFETMFYGDMADKSKYIRIADVAPIGFENLLRYAYTDSLNLSTVEDAMLTAYAAKKYLLPQLLRECLTFIEHNIGPSTACVVFEFAHVLNSQQLVLQAMNLIDRQTISVITSKSFNHVQATTVEFVANRKYLNLNTEFTLFNAILNWSLAEAKRRNFDTSDWSLIRSIVGKENCILSAIRFLAMSQEEFAKAVAKTSTCVRTAPAIDQQQQSMELDEANSNTDGNNNNPTSGDDLNNNNNNKQQIIIDMIDTENANSLLSHVEQRAVFLNLALGDVAKLPPLINRLTQIRQAPPEYFTLRRFKSGVGSGASGGGSNLIVTTTTTRSIKSIYSKFQCLSENVFIVGLTIPIRLDASSYANRTPKFECHLKFTTKATGGGGGGQHQTGTTINNDHLNNSNGINSLINQQDNNNNNGNIESVTGANNAHTTLLMDTIDESLHISIARDKDCLVRLKRPILVRMANLNELTLTFQTYALDEDIVALRTPKARSANFSELTDGENTSWLFFKTPGVEFSELHYYY